MAIGTHGRRMLLFISMLTFLNGSVGVSLMVATFDRICAPSTRPFESGVCCRINGQKLCPETIAGPRQALSDYSEMYQSSLRQGQVTFALMLAHQTVI